MVGVDGQRQGARQPGQVEGEGAPGKLAGCRVCRQIVGEEGLDPLVHRREAVREPAAQLALALEERPDEALVGVDAVDPGKAEEGEP